VNVAGTVSGQMSWLCDKCLKNTLEDFWFQLPCTDWLVLELSKICSYLHNGGVLACHTLLGDEVYRYCSKGFFLQAETLQVFWLIIGKVVFMPASVLMLALWACMEHNFQCTDFLRRETRAVFAPK